MTLLRVVLVTALAIGLYFQAPREACGETGCCRDFEIFCQGYCYGKGSEVLLTNCSCTLGYEHCICVEGDPYAGPNWYCDCLEG